MKKNLEISYIYINIITLLHYYTINILVYNKNFLRHTNFILKNFGKMQDTRVNIHPCDGQ